MALFDRSIDHTWLPLSLFNCCKYCAISCTISELLDVEEYRDLENLVSGHLHCELARSIHLWKKIHIPGAAADNFVSIFVQFYTASRGKSYIIIIIIIIITTIIVKDICNAQNSNIYTKCAKSAVKQKCLQFGFDVK